MANFDTKLYCVAPDTGTLRRLQLGYESAYHANDNNESLQPFWMLHYGQAALFDTNFGQVAPNKITRENELSEKHSTRLIFGSPAYLKLKEEVRT